jgi:hypothetical protein
VVMTVVAVAVVVAVVAVAVVAVAIVRVVLLKRATRLDCWLLAVRNVAQFHSRTALCGNHVILPCGQSGTQHYILKLSDPFPQGDESVQC